jgi:hypothetical protein
MTKRVKYGACGVTGGNGASGASGDKKMRRSITVTENNHKGLLRARGELMSLLQVDADYTTSLNMFLELGLRRYNSRQLSPEEMRVITEYLADENLRSEGCMDELTDLVNKQLQRQSFVQNRPSP